MLQKIALIFGSVVLLIGFLGFTPLTSEQGELFGIFKVNQLTNLIYIALGLFALWSGLQGRLEAKNGFRFLAFVLGLFAVLGFIYGNEDIFGLIANNIISSWGRLVLALLSAYFGFVYQEKYIKV